MAANLHDTQEFSFENEGANYGVDPLSLVGDSTYYFGEYQTVYDYPVIKTDEFLQYYNSLDPSLSIDGNTKIETSVIFKPVNGLMDHLTLGGVSGAGVAHDTGVFTLTPQEQGVKLNSITTRMDSGNDTENIREHFPGNKIQSKIESIDFESDTPLTTVLQMDGQRRVDPAYDDDHTPEFPSSKRDMYYKDATNTVLTWNGNDILPYALNFTWTEYNLNQIFIPDQQSYPKDIRRGNRLIVFGFDVYRGHANAKTLWTDAKARTARSLVFKINNTSSLYRQNTFNNSKIGIVMNKTISNLKQKPVYRVTGKALSISPVNKDGLATSFYGV